MSNFPAHGRAGLAPGAPDEVLRWAPPAPATGDRIPEFRSPGDPGIGLWCEKPAAFRQEKYAAFHAELTRRGLESPYEKIFAEWEERARKRQERGDRPLEITTKINVADYFQIRDDALRAHATQIDPNGHWFAVPRDVERVAWPTEDYHLVRSLVDTELPEDDLFAGIRESVTL